MIGYCATGSSGMAIAPIKQIKSATTHAKIGLSIKKLGIDPSSAPPVRWSVIVRRHPAVRVQPHVRLRPCRRPTNFWNPSTTTLVAGLEPVEDQPLARPAWSRCGPARCDRLSCLDDEHFAAAAGIALDRLLRHGDRVAVDALLDLNAHIHARQQFALRIRKFAAQSHLTGFGVDLGLGKQQLARQADKRCRRRAPGAPWPRQRAMRSRSPRFKRTAQLVELGRPTA